MDESSKTYNIIHNSSTNHVIASPQWKGVRKGYQKIGEYAPSNPRAHLDTYVNDLMDGVRAALIRLEGSYPINMMVSVKPLDGTPERQIPV